MEHNEIRQNDKKKEKENKKNRGKKREINI